MSKRLVLLSGSCHPSFAEAISKRLGINLSPVTLSKFSNGETRVEVQESVRNSDVFIVQSCSPSPNSASINDAFMELLIMIHACKIASAARITAVLPYFPYSVQPGSGSDKITNSIFRQYCSKLIINTQRDPQSQSSGSSNNYKLWSARSGTLICNMLLTAGTNQIITMDLHDPQFQGCFNIPVDNLFGMPLIIKTIKESLSATYKNAVIVSPDAGGAKRATQLANSLQTDFAMVHKDKRKSQSSSSPNIPLQKTFSNNQHSSSNLSNTGLKSPQFNESHISGLILVGDVGGKHAIILDDLADTCSTVIRAALLLVSKGAISVTIIVTHGLLSNSAVDRIRECSAINKVLISNSLPQPQEHSIKSGDKIQTWDVSGIFAEAIRRIHFGESVSYLFDPCSIGIF